jgi:enoyl-CoA hydratase
VTVEYQVRGSTAIITVSRTERRNAIDRATAAALGDAWDRVAADPTIRVGILTGAGGHFSAGADLRAFDLVDSGDGFLGFTRRVATKPTIAAVEGYCIAGGLEMAIWCDLRVASSTAVFGCFERRFGVPLVDGGTQRLPRIVGLGRALDLILSGRPVGAREALEMGLVNRLVAPGRALQVALELADTIGGYPPAALTTDLRAVHEGIGRPLHEGLELERQLGLTVLEEAIIGAERFAAGEGRGGSAVP